MNGTCCEASTPIGHVYLPAARVLSPSCSPCNGQTNPRTIERQHRGVVDFLDAVPAIRESGITQPLHQLLAALPDLLLRLASCWNQLTAELLRIGRERCDHGGDRPVRCCGCVASEGISGCCCRSSPRPELAVAAISHHNSRSRVARA